MKKLIMSPSKRLVEFTLANGTGIICDNVLSFEEIELAKTVKNSLESIGISTSDVTSCKGTDVDIEFVLKLDSNYKIAYDSKAKTHYIYHIAFSRIE